MNRDVAVREVMDREFLAASESDDLVETVAVMVREDREPAVVVRGSETVGVLGDRDVLAMLASDGPAPGDATVADAMVESVPSIEPEATLSAARDRMATRSTPWLVVTDGGTPEGVITQHDVLTSSTIGTEVDAAESAGPENATEQQERGVAAGVGGAPGAGTSESMETDGFEEQGICEKCGSLSRGLTSFNGQLLCADCRDI